MGAAQSNNVATAISNVSNFVSSSTVANNAQASDIKSKVFLGNCTVKLSGDVNFIANSKLMQQNNQIVMARQNSAVTNNLSQQMLQTATSTVGSMGIGYADASNSASETVNNTNQVINAMTVGCSQYSTINNNFVCNGSTILAKNLDISFDSSADFISSQTLNNNQVTQISNDITQSITQKATATVEGISGLLFMIILALGVVIYFAMKPLSSGSFKSIVGVGMCLVFAIIIMLMYLKQTPPFFSSPQECINNSSMGTGGDPCINLQSKKITLAHPPLRYIYALTPSNTSQPCSNLVQMAVAAKSNQSIAGGAGPNGGYTGKTYGTLVDTLANTSNGSNYTNWASTLNIPMIPNPLVVPSMQINDANGNPVTAYYGIPVEYIPTASTGSGYDAICTPGTVQVDNSGKTGFYDPGDGDKNNASCSAFSNSQSWSPPKTWGDKETTLMTTDINSSVANLNIQDWDDYINMNGKYPPTTSYVGNDEANTRALFARFVLCDLIGNIDLHYYVNKKELVKFLGQDGEFQLGLAFNDDGTPQYPNDTYLYHPYSMASNWSNGLVGSGYIVGDVGVVNNNNYKFQNFMQKIGGYAMLGSVLLIFVYMFYTYYTGTKKNNDSKK
jgi:hypothetical protein